MTNIQTPTHSCSCLFDHAGQPVEECVYHQELGAQLADRDRRLAALTRELEDDPYRRRLLKRAEAAEGQIAAVRAECPKAVDAVNRLHHAAERSVTGITGHDWGKRAEFERDAKAVLAVLALRPPTPATPPFSCMVCGQAKPFKVSSIPHPQDGVCYDCAESPEKLRDAEATIHEGQQHLAAQIGLVADLTQRLDEARCTIGDLRMQLPTPDTPPREPQIIETGKWFVERRHPERPGFNQVEGPMSDEASAARLSEWQAQTPDLHAHRWQHILPATDPPPADRPSGWHGLELAPDVSWMDRGLRALLSDGRTIGLGYVARRPDGSVNGSLDGFNGSLSDWRIRYFHSLPTPPEADRPQEPGK